MNILGPQPILFSISNITKNRTAFIRLDTHRLYNQIKATSALKLLSKIRISKQEQIVKHNQLITKPHLFTRKFRSLFKTLNQRGEKWAATVDFLFLKEKLANSGYSSGRFDSFSRGMEFFEDKMPPPAL